MSWIADQHLSKRPTAPTAHFAKSAPGRCCRKSLFRVEYENFKRPLMRFARGNLRTHIDSNENDHRPSYWLQRTLPLQQCRKNDFRETFSVFRFSTFSTASTRCGRHDAVPFAQSFVKLERGAQRQFEAQSTLTASPVCRSLPTHGARAGNLTRVVFASLGPAESTKWRRRSFKSKSSSRGMFRKQ